MALAPPEPPDLIDLLQVGEVVDLAGSVFVPATDRVARVTFAWLDGGHLRAKVLADGRASTIVTVWPTTIAGRIVQPPSAPLVQEWRLTNREVQDLRRWTDLWPPDRHDFLVAAAISPCPQTLRTSAAFAAARKRVDTLIHSVMSNTSTKRAMSSGRGRQ